MEEVRSGRIPFSKLDVLHRRNLERILPRFGISGLSEDAARNLNLAWHRLDAWPDVPPGMARLKRRVMLAPVSNGNISLMVDLARRNNLPWDAILGSETAGDFKPKPRVYLAACEALDLPPGECMMVAAHTNDLLAAAKCGLRTAHVARPNEKGRAPAKPPRRRRSTLRRAAWKIWRPSSAREAVSAQQVPVKSENGRVVDRVQEHRCGEHPAALVNERSAHTPMTKTGMTDAGGCTIAKMAALASVAATTPSVRRSRRR